MLLRSTLISSLHNGNFPGFLKKNSVKHFSYIWMETCKRRLFRALVTWPFKIKRGKKMTDSSDVMASSTLIVNIQNFFFPSKSLNFMEVQY